MKRVNQGSFLKLRENEIALHDLTYRGGAYYQIILKIYKENNMFKLERSRF